MTIFVLFRKWKLIEGTNLASLTTMIPIRVLPPGLLFPAIGLTVASHQVNMCLTIPSGKMDGY